MNPGYPERQFHCNPPCGNMSHRKEMATRARSGPVGEAVATGSSCMVVCTYLARKRTWTSLAAGWSQSMGSCSKASGQSWAAAWGSRVSGISSPCPSRLTFVTVFPTSVTHAPPAPPTTTTMKACATCATQRVQQTSSELHNTNFNE